jgi:hypothetical protein
MGNQSLMLCKSRSYMHPRQTLLHGVSQVQNHQEEVAGTSGGHRSLHRLTGSGRALRSLGKSFAAEAFVHNHQAIVGVCQNSINDSSSHHSMGHCLCLYMSSFQPQTSCCQRLDLFCRSANIFNCSSSHPCLLLNSDSTTPETSRAILAEPQM